MADFKTHEHISQPPPHANNRFDLENLEPSRSRSQWVELIKVYLNLKCEELWTMV